MRNILNKRIPTLLGLLFLVVGIGAVIFTAGNTTNFQGEASPQDEPKNIRISDTTSQSFTVSFTTETDVLASVVYGTVNTDLSQNITEGTEAKSAHLITVSGLSPRTEYYFKIISGRSEYNDNGSPFVVSTGPVINTEPASGFPVKGKVLKPDGSESGDTLVYLTAANASVIAKQTDTDGSFIFDTSDLLTENLSSYFQAENLTQLSLTALDTNSELTAVFLATEADPLPTITLGQAYNFTLSDSASEASVSAESIGFPIFRENATEERVVSIETPEANEGFSDQRPSFEGTALPNETVEITIQSSHEIKTSVNTNTSGNWEYRPETPLEPGEHTITIKTRDKNGILRILTRPFTVYAQGSQFTEPSVSPPPVSPTITPTVPISSSPSPTLGPSATQEITPITTVVPTQTPVPALQASPTPLPKIDETGPANIPLVIVSSVVILISGMFFYFLAKFNSL